MSDEYTERARRAVRLYVQDGMPYLRIEVGDVTCMFLLHESSGLHEGIVAGVRRLLAMGFAAAAREARRAALEEAATKCEAIALEPVDVSRDDYWDYWNGYRDGYEDGADTCAVRLEEMASVAKEQKNE